MIPIKTETNYLMDWNNPQDRINYFRNLRNFLLEIKAEIDEVEDANQSRDAISDCSQCGLPLKLMEIFVKWNVYFIDVDEIPRVNLDEPKGGNK